MPDSVASALAMSVLLQPGGPYSSTPRGGDMPILKNASGCLSGHSTTCGTVLPTMRFKHRVCVFQLLLQRSLGESVSHCSIGGFGVNLFFFAYLVEFL